MREVEAAHGGEPIASILETLYYEEQLTQLEIAERLQVPAGTLAGWMVRMGIGLRTLADKGRLGLAG